MTIEEVNTLINVGAILIFILSVFGRCHVEGKLGAVKAQNFWFLVYYISGTVCLTTWIYMFFAGCSK